MLLSWHLPGGWLCSEEGPEHLLGLPCWVPSPFLEWLLPSLAVTNSILVQPEVALEQRELCSRCTASENRSYSVPEPTWKNLTRCKAMSLKAEISAQVLFLAPSATRNTAVLGFPMHQHRMAQDSGKWHRMAQCSGKC